MPQAQPHADAGAHADAGIHRLERRQHAQRVAADVAGDDAVELRAGRSKTVRCGQPWQSAAACPRRRRGSGEVSPARMRAHARHVQLAEAVHLRLALDGDTRGADGLARYGSPSSITTQRSTLAAKARIVSMRQRIGHAQLENAGLGGRLAGVHDGDARGDDAQVAVPPSMRCVEAVASRSTAAISASLARRRRWAGRA